MPFPIPITVRVRVRVPVSSAMERGCVCVGACCCHCAPGRNEAYVRPGWPERIEWGRGALIPQWTGTGTGTGTAWMRGNAASARSERSYCQYVRKGHGPNLHLIPSQPGCISASQNIVRHCLCHCHSTIVYTYPPLPLTHRPLSPSSPLFFPIVPPPLPLTLTLPPRLLLPKLARLRLSISKNPVLAGGAVCADSPGEAG